MSEKVQKYLYKLSNIYVNDSKFGVYLTKLNYWYDQYGGGKACDEYTDEKKCNKASNEKKEKCAWKLLDEPGLNLEKLPPSYYCVTQSYKQERSFCSPLTSKELCKNSKSFKDLPQKSIQVGKKTNYVNDITDCVWFDGLNKCGYKK